MTTLSLEDLLLDQSFRGIHTVPACDPDDGSDAGPWTTKRVALIRVGNGYREVPIVDFSRLDEALAQLNREHAEGRVGDVLISAPMFSDREVI